MDIPIRQALAAALALAATASACAQNVVPDRPATVPPVQVSSKEEKERQAAKSLFIRASLRYRQDRYLEAIRDLEECLRLDPQAVPPQRLLSSLYRIVGRTDDALRCARKVTELAPAAADGWERYADLLHENHQLAEAAAALKMAADCPDLAKLPDRQFTLLKRVLGWYEKLGDLNAAAVTATRVLGSLDKNGEIFVRMDFLSKAELSNEKADAYERLGRVQLRAKKLAEAEDAFARAAEVFSKRNDAPARARSARLKYYLAEIEMGLGHPAKAVEYLTPYLETKPREIEPYRLWVAAHDRLGEEREKVRGLQKFAERDKANLTLQFLLAEQLGASGDFNEAQSAFLALVRDVPRVDVYKGLFRLYAENHRLDAGLQKLDEYLAIIEDKSKSEEARIAAGQQAQAIYAVLRDQPAWIRGLLPLAQAEQARQARFNQNFSYRTFEVLAGLAARSGELAAAEQLLRESVDNARGRFQNASLREALILVLLAQRKYAETIDVCESGLDGRGNNKFMYNYYKAFPLAQLGRTDDAVRAIEQAILDAHSDGTKLSARLRKVDILSWIGSHTEAAAECQEILKDFPRADQVRQTRLRLALVYSAARDHARSEQQLRLLLERDPNDARVCNDLGYQLADQNRNLDEAERLIRRAIALNRAERQQGLGGADDDFASTHDNAAYIDSLGWVLFRRGRLAEARQWLDRAVSLPDGKEDPSVWDHLGDVNYRLGESDKALQAWQTARKFYLEERRSKKDGRLQEVERKLRIADTKPN